MPLPKKIIKDIPLTTPKTLFPRREELLNKINKDGTYLPKSLLHADLDGGMLNFVKESLKTTVAGKTIPMIDIFSGIVDFYPDNKLTEYLLDLRSYRPRCIQNFFNDLRNHYKINPLFKQLTDAKCYEGLVYLLKIVDEVYLFRNGHWQFVQKYIMSNTRYAFATGGTPITTWLINQIEAVLEYERVIIEYLESNSDDELKDLVKKTLSENLTSKSIKQSIQNWQADNWRL
jgi:hypothetical protein